MLICGGKCLFIFAMAWAGIYHCYLDACIILARDWGASFMACYCVCSVHYIMTVQLFCENYLLVFMYGEIRNTT